ncbi:MAG: cytochrome P450 [Actinocatenispora sp.]
MPDTVMVDLRALDDPAARADPYPILRALRERAPLWGADGTLLVVGSHQHCHQVLRAPQVSCDRSASRLSHAARSPETKSFLYFDPPDHTRLRRLVSTAFTPRVVSGLAPHIQRITDDLIDAAAARGEFDVVRDLANPLPLRIICELLGVPDVDHGLMRDWSTPVARSSEPEFITAEPGADAEAEDGRNQLAAYFRDLIAERRANPRDDLVSYLVGVEDDGDVLTDYETVATCVLLLVAGHETTANLIASALVALLRHPDQFAALAADPGLADGTVEESLRYDAPVQLTTRVVRGSITVGGEEAADGTVLLLLLAAANRDPAVFDNPDRFDLHRRPGRHLAFAAGPHFCLGAGLARIEGAIALRTLTDRLVRPRLDEDRLRYKPNVNLRGPAQVIVDADDIRPAGAG